MPVELDAVSGGADLIPGSTTSGSKAVPLADAGDAQDVAAFLAVLFTTNVDLTAATFTPSWKGVPMTLLDDPRYWDSNQGMLRVYKLEDPPAGPGSVSLAYSGLSSEVDTRNLMLIPSTYQGVEAIGEPVDAGGGSTTSNSITVASVLPAHRVVSWHGVGKLRGFTKTGHNKSKRQSVTMLGGGALMQQDAEGAASVTMTATNNLATVNWGAIGVSLAPAKVSSSIYIPLGLSLKTAAGTYRTAPPGKFWEIPAGAPISETI